MKESNLFAIFCGGDSDGVKIDDILKVSSLSKVKQPYILDLLVCWDGIMIRSNFSFRNMVLIWGYNKGKISGWGGCSEWINLIYDISIDELLLVDKNICLLCNSKAVPISLMCELSCWIELEEYVSWSLISRDCVINIRMITPISIDNYNEVTTGVFFLMTWD